MLFFSAILVLNIVHYWRNATQFTNTQFCSIFLIGIKHVMS